ncbi:uncharacterized protein LOC117590630 [Drosophila guanche]|uniref:uncharacterized protein LOC117590630 n=1 Tax=Drosophila guanche TaxID=7266 RepID=UPI0014719D8D|nr:uncharacterized protein LOC117590630 [Drosophila guanche]
MCAGALGVRAEEGQRNRRIAPANASEHQRPEACNAGAPDECSDVADPVCVVEIRSGEPLHARRRGDIQAVCSKDRVLVPDCVIGGQVPLRELVTERQEIHTAAQGGGKATRAKLKATARRSAISRWQTQWVGLQTTNFLLSS